MNEKTARIRQEQFGKALDRLKEMIDLPADYFARREGLIQTFEYTIELCWKTLKAVLELNGRFVNLPRDILKESFAAGWLGDDDKIWFRMIDDRNMTSHTYKEELADQVVRHVEGYYPLLRRTHDLLKTKIEE
ncbi:MAG: HI0074 family nucleotidyltransferase substrate-binding subunit [Alphaproteobacteria bacterium]